MPPGRYNLACLCHRHYAENEIMMLEEGRLFAAACAADLLTGHTWPRAAALEPPKGWPQSARGMC
eukprot:363869-Chlamydomonas_euryale.AAC.18